MKVIQYRNYVKRFLSRYQPVHRKYWITTKDELHIMDSEFIIQEINESSDEEIEVFYDVFRQMDSNVDIVHNYLEHIAALYIKTNKV